MNQIVLLNIKKLEINLKQTHLTKEGELNLLVSALKLGSKIIFVEKFFNRLNIIFKCFLERLFQNINIEPLKNNKKF